MPSTKKIGKSIRIFYFAHIFELVDIRKREIKRMGMSSSQARLLNLTARMHQIEYKAARLEAQKLQMANESTRVYNDYLEALDKTKLQTKILKNDGSIDYIDATYNILVSEGYKLSASGALAVTQADIDFFNNVADINAKEFAILKSGYGVKNGDEIVLASDPTKTLAFNQAQLQAAVSNRKDIVLMDNIEISSSLGTLRSSLDGNGNTVSVSGSSGMFTQINGASIKDLNINADITTTSSQVGALAGLSYGSNNIENVNVNGNITSNNNAGGLIGYVYSGSVTMNNISVNISINNTATEYDSGKASGGLIGISKGSVNISNISSTTQFRGMNTFGGIIGNAKSQTIISNATSHIDLNGGSNAGYGGIVGWHCPGSNTSLIENCYVDGTMIGYGNSACWLGGVVGNLYPNGAGYPATINNCYSNIYREADTGTGLNIYTGDIVGALNNSSAGGANLINSASQNGTSSGTLSGTASNGPMNFTQAASADAVLSQVKTATANVGSNASVSYDPTSAPNYQTYYEIGQAIASGNYFLLDGHEDDNTWLTNMINSGFVILSKPDEKGNYYDTSVSTDTNLQEVDDKVLLKKAEAKYEADMKKIDMKDRKYDTDLAALDTERNAIKSEIDTLKTVAKDNVDRTFKLFG